MRQGSEFGFFSHDPTKHNQTPMLASAYVPEIDMSSQSSQGDLFETFRGSVDGGGVRPRV